jgi:hypothetical protein
VKTTGVLEEYIASIFWSTTKPSKKPALNMQEADYSTLKMEALCSSEKLVYFHHNTKRFIPEDRSLPHHCCENLISSILSVNEIDEAHAFHKQNLQ